MDPDRHGQFVLQDVGGIRGQQEIHMEAGILFPEAGDAALSLTENSILRGTDGFHQVVIPAADDAVGDTFPQGHIRCGIQTNELIPERELVVRIFVQFRLHPSLHVLQEADGRQLLENPVLLRGECPVRQQDVQHQDGHQQGGEAHRGDFHDFWIVFHALSHLFQQAGIRTGAIAGCLVYRYQNRKYRNGL